MVREILGLDKNVYLSVKELLPRAVKEHKERKSGIVDLELSDAVILKAYDDQIVLDLGGEFVIIKDRSFEYIEMR